MTVGSVDYDPPLSFMSFMATPAPYDESELHRDVDVLQEGHVIQFTNQNSSSPCNYKYLVIGSEGRKFYLKSFDAERVFDARVNSPEHLVLQDYLDSSDRPPLERNFRIVECDREETEKFLKQCPINAHAIHPGMGVTLTVLPNPEDLNTYPLEIISRSQAQRAFSAYSAALRREVTLTQLENFKWRIHDDLQHTYSSCFRIASEDLRYLQAYRSVLKESPSISVRDCLIEGSKRAIEVIVAVHLTPLAEDNPRDVNIAKIVVDFLKGFHFPPSGLLPHDVAEIQQLSHKGFFLE